MNIILLQSECVILLKKYINAILYDLYREMAKRCH